MLLLWDSKSGRLSHAAAKGFPSGYLSKLSSAQLAEAAGPFLINANTPLIIHDADTDRRLAMSTFSELIRENSPFRSLVSIPLRHRRLLIGFLNLAHTSPALFPRDRENFFAILGNQIGMAIQNIRLNQALRLSERRYRRIFEGSNDMILVVSTYRPPVRYQSCRYHFAGICDKIPGPEKRSLPGLFLSAQRLGPFSNFSRSTWFSPRLGSHLDQT